MGGVSDEFAGELLIELVKYSINKLGKKWDEHKA